MCKRNFAGYKISQRALKRIPKMYDRNHYIQKRLLKNFSTTAENGKNKICVLDLVKFSADYRNIENAFYERNLYDVKKSDDAKQLEKRFNEVIECPITKLFDRISNPMQTVSFTRKELYLIKKYFLLQLYRTPCNKRSYTDKADGNLRFSRYNIADNETAENFWKKEMLTILNSDWDDLLKTDMVGVRKHALDVNSSFMMILKTNGEFCINDIGYVAERIPITIPKERQEDYIANVKKMGTKIYGIDDLDVSERYAVEHDNVYIDNYTIFPISSDCAILLVSEIWKHIYFHPEVLSHFPVFSPILLEYLSFPQHEYINKDKIHTDADLAKYKDEKDKFIYTIQNIKYEDEIHLNLLMLNEAYRFVGIKTPSALIPSIKVYNSLMSSGAKNLHHNLAGFVELLNKL